MIKNARYIYLDLKSSLRCLLIGVFILFCGSHYSFARNKIEEVCFTVRFNMQGSSINPRMGNNAAILDSLVRYINSQSGQKKHIKISIKGSASSEGDAVMNKELANRRAQALKSYLQKHVGARNLRISLEKSDVDWSMLRRMVANSRMPKRSQVLNILDNTPEYIFREGVIVDSRKSQLMNVNYGRAWHYMDENFFPAMRYATATCIVEGGVNRNNNEELNEANQDDNSLSTYNKSENNRSLDKADKVVIEIMETKSAPIVQVTGNNYATALGMVEEFSKKNEQVIIEFSQTESDFKVTPEERRMIMKMRAEKLKEKIEKNSKLNLTVIVDENSIDWNALAQMIEKSNLRNKEEILEILRSGAEYVMNNGQVVDSRRLRLMNLANGAAWRQIEKDYLPKLPKVCSVFAYSHPLKTMTGMELSGMKLREVITSAAPIIKITDQNYESAVDKVNKLQRRNLTKTEIIRFGIEGNTLRGNEANVKALLRRRAEALVDSIQRNTDCSNLMVIIDEDAIDFVQFRKMIEISQLPNKDAILSVLDKKPEYIVRNGQVVDSRSIELMTMDNGKTWAYLKRNFVPALPRLCTVNVVAIPRSTLLNAHTLNEISATVAKVNVESVKGDDYTSALDQVDNMRTYNSSKVELSHFFVDANDVTGTPAERRAEAKRRAEALCAELEKAAEGSNLMVVVDENAIDFAQLRSVVAKSNIPNKKEIIKILESQPEYRVEQGKVVESRLAQLQALNNGETWKYLEKHVIPNIDKVYVVSVVSFPSHVIESASRLIEVAATPIAAVSPEQIVSGDNYSEAIKVVAKMAQAGSKKAELQRFAIDASDISGTPAECRAELQSRAEALRAELQKTADGSNLTVVVDENGIDFNALRAEIEKSDIPNKKEILKIIDSQPNYTIIGGRIIDSRKTQLEELKNGAVWKEIEETILPKIPAVYTVNVVSVPENSTGSNHRLANISDQQLSTLGSEVKISSDNFKGAVEKVEKIKSRNSSQVEMIRFAIEEDGIKGTPAERRAAVRRRAAALRTELQRKTDGSNIMVVVDENGIDVEELRKQLEKSDLPNRKETLFILKGDAGYKIVDGNVVDTRILKLQEYNGGNLWRQIQEKILPNVPKVCSVNVVSVPEDPDVKTGRLTQALTMFQDPVKIASGDINLAVEKIRKQQRYNSSKPVVSQFVIESVNGAATPQEQREQVYNRAEALRDSLQAGAKRTNMSVVIEEESIDWEALRKLVEKSNMPNKREVLDIITSRPEFIVSNGVVSDSRKTLLKTLNNGEGWRYIEENFLPFMPVTCTLHVITFPDDSMNKPLIPIEVTEYIAESNYGLKSNLLSDGILVPSVGFEFGHGHYSAALMGYYGWWSDKRPLYANLIGGDFSLRWWPYQAMKGHHLGIYAQAFTFDVMKDRIGHYAKPFSYAVGVEYGYSLKLSNRFRMELTVGGGYTKGQMDQYKRYSQGDITQDEIKWLRIFPTKAELSFVWLLSEK